VYMCLGKEMCGIVELVVDLEGKDRRMDFG
jgi:hypothetical protein